MNNKINTERTLNGLRLKSIYITDDIFEELKKSYLSEIDYIYLSSNNTLNEKQIKYLFTLEIDNININLLRNKNCPHTQIDKFLLLHDKIYNIAIAHNINLSPSHIESLLKINDTDIKISLEFSGLI